MHISGVSQARTARTLDAQTLVWSLDEELDQRGGLGFAAERRQLGHQPSQVGARFADYERTAREGFVNPRIQRAPFDPSAVEVVAITKHVDHDLRVPIKGCRPFRRYVRGQAQGFQPAVTPRPADDIVEQAAPGETTKQTFACRIGAANETNSMAALTCRRGVVEGRRVSNGHFVSVLVARHASRIVDQDEIEVPGPSCGVVDLVRLVEQPDGGAELCEAFTPALHETPTMHDEEQVGAKAFNLLG